ncbi:MAG: dimethylarginine dimethylaminohydrolase family protein [Acidimicrobiales bacterium]
MTDRLGWGRRYLLVEPRHFDVTYCINPWMQPGVDTAAAQLEWKRLAAALESLGATVHVAGDQPGLPDMAFAMNAGFVWGSRAVPSRFRHAERRAEEPHWRACFEQLGLEVVELPAPPEVRFEAGDAFVQDGLLVGGWGFRSDRAALDALGEVCGLPVLPLRLVDERFYHFDTCFCPLGQGAALAYLDAFSPDDAARLVKALPHVIALDASEAVAFAANSLVVGNTFVTARCPDRVAAELARLGLDVMTVEVSEFQKSGGSVRCLTLPLDLGPEA